MSSTVVQPRKGAITEVTWVAFAGGEGHRAGLGAGVIVPVCAAASPTCAMRRRRGGRVHDVLRIRGHVIIGFDARPSPCRRGSGSGIDVRLRRGRDKLLGVMVGGMVARCLLV